MSNQVQADARRPIGVFDSGVGGLTVLDAIHRALPGEDLVYLGDTARVPYGTKSPESVARYARQAALALVQRNVKALVIACNTASAVAVELLRDSYPTMPILGVVEPGAKASCEASTSGHIGIIATESTIAGGAYQAAVRRLRPSAVVHAQACSLFVALAEEGWTEGELLERVLERYLGSLQQSDAPGIDTLVLGCTHFPVLKNAIANVLGSQVRLVDSAETTAAALTELLTDSGELHPEPDRQGEIRYLVTDGTARFARVAGTFFSRPVRAEEVELIDIPQLQK
ncbi:glutamate racemase [Motiliproteus sediminis]|uniref:glutamate racemase n=1 Tax=Motiliproteus sediminis TaxID=1468178 RepID=UPI001AF00D3E